MNPTTTPHPGAFNTPRLRRNLIGLGLALGGGLVQAGYLTWETVELPLSSGASCGNGTPYRFFVNRTPFNRHYALTFEGGGACWGQDACEGKTTLGAWNPDGIHTNYLTDLGKAPHGGLISPLSARIDPFQSVRTQAWNLVYLPYCTGDVHVGNATRVYAEARPASPRVQYHRGQANIRAASEWLRSHERQVDQLMLTGFSAGGVGSTVNYAVVRDTLAPAGKMTLLADSGPLFNAPAGATAQQAPSRPLHEKIRAAWNLDAPGSIIPTLAAKVPGQDTTNMGTLSTALARKYPQDRFAYLFFQQDMNFSAFSYTDFHPGIAGETNDALRKQRLNALWRQDIAQLLPTLDPLPNISYHVPFFRNFNDSHCLTVVDFWNTGVEDKGVASLTPFINSQLDRGPAMRNVEQDQSSDLNRPLSFGMAVLKLIQSLFG